MEEIKRTGLLGLGPRRKRAGYTQAAFAEELGIERSALANYEAGLSWPSARLLPDMADLLCCTVDDLYRAPEDGAEAARRVGEPYDDIIPGTEAEIHAE